jgi:hypothetical protein
MHEMKSMCPVHKAAWVLVLVGALNWGLTALGYNLVNMALGGVPLLEKAVYLLVGISAVLMLLAHKCKMCHADMAKPAMTGGKPPEPPKGM